MILRKTYGWHKKEDHIGLGQFSEMTGLTRQHALRAIKKLEAKHVIAVTKNGNSGVNSYKFIKDFDKWRLLPKKDTLLPNLVGGVTKNGVGVLPKMVHTKENTKENTKERPFILPEYIPKETWAAYMAVRVKKRAAKTTYALTLIIKELEKINKDYGQAPLEVLNKSIKNGWTDVYPLKEPMNNGQSRNEPEGQKSSW